MTKRIAIMIVPAFAVLFLAASIAGDAATRTNEPGNAEGEKPEILTLNTYAFFESESYTPLSVATLVIKAEDSELELRVYQSGPERMVLSRRRDTMNGLPVTEPLVIQWKGAGSPTRLRYWIGDWKSGFYYLEIRTGDEITYAPFIVRPATLGENRVAVVLPTNTWQAYNYYDMDADGVGDTWYAKRKIRTVPLDRPYLDNGVPPYFKRYDLPFLLWLVNEGKSADFLSDADLDEIRSEELANAYDLIVFPGHTEYVTDEEYDAIQEYRDLGGNLIFLSANNFFWRVEKKNRLMSRTALWRDLGRPESALVGVQYRGNDRGRRRGPFVVRGVESTPWLFEGTGLNNGSAFGDFGIEIDKTAASSPAGTVVVAQIPNLFGPGFTAEMTYYETKNGAKVFAAGAFTLAGSALNGKVRLMLRNLWHHLGPTEPQVEPDQPLTE